MHRSCSTLIRPALFALCVFSLQACSPARPSNEVAMIYETSGAVVMKPYHNSIFSSTNF